MDEQKQPLHELLRKFAALRGLPVKETPKGLACRMPDKTILTIFYRPVSKGHFTACAMKKDLSEKFPHTQLYDKSLADYMRNKIEESIEILELRKRIMDPEKLETAECMARKRRKLQEVYDLLSIYPTTAEIRVTVRTCGNKLKEVGISEDTFNALVCKLAEDEINRINEFVKSL